VSRQQYLQELLKYWQDKAGESLEAARDEFQAGRYAFTVNRLYYVCFYVITAVFLQENIVTKKHSGLRAAFHRDFVKTGRVNVHQGKLFDELFEARQRGDYVGLIFFDREEVEDWVQRTSEFLQELISLLKT
jgi:uncharacterized protein (UPF0332 family)